MIQVTRQGRGPRMLGMMGVILLCALGFAAIKSPGGFAGLAVAVSSLAILTVATFGAIFAKPKAFWAGFAVVGWASMLLASNAWLDDRNAHAWANGTGPFCNLPPIALYYWWDQTAYWSAVRHVYDSGPYTSEALLRMSVYPQVAVAQGLVGGLVALGLARRGRKGKNLAEVVGWAGTILTSLSLFVALFALGYLYPMSPWGAAAILATHVLLFGALVGGVIGPNKGFWRGYAAFGAIGLLIMVRHPVLEGAFGLPLRQGFTSYIVHAKPVWPNFQDYFRNSDVADHVAASAAALLGGVTGWVIERRIARGRRP